MAPHAVEGLERRVLLSAAIATFAPQLTFAAGSEPVSVSATSDVNGDGKLDLVVADYGENKVSVLLGKGNGVFLPRKTFATGPGPQVVRVEDFNGDGKPDLAVTNAGKYPALEHTVSILLGNGNGTFKPQATLATSTSPVALTVGDFNSDGRADIAVASALDDLVGVFLGNGNGTFQTQQTFATGGAARSVSADDVNGDGKADLIVGNQYQNSCIGVLLGNGDGTFLTQQTYAGGSLPSDALSADLNRDGVPDLIATDESHNDITVLLGNRGGGFQSPQTFVTEPFPRTPVLQDMNGDGVLDAVIACANSEHAEVLLGNPDGTFQAPATFGAGPNTWAVSVADVNGDGRLDILAANRTSNSVSVILGDVPPTMTGITLATSNPTADSVLKFNVTFSEPVTGVDASNFQVAVAGSVLFNSVVVVGSTGNQYTVTVTGVSGAGSLGLNFIDRGNITDLAGNPLQPSTVVSNFTPRFAENLAQGPTGVAIADFNRDGRLDLATANWLANSVGVILQTPDGSFPNQQLLPSGTNPYSIVAVDLNGDGNPDLVSASVGSLDVWLGLGNGQFGPRHTMATPNNAPGQLIAADINRDGRQDILLTDHEGFLRIFLGNGDGTFSAPMTMSNGNAQFQVAVADINGDGRPDVAFTSGPNQVHVMLGNGDGTFGPVRSMTVSKYASAVAIGDLNGDGKPDLIVGDTNVSVFLGNGDGTFRPRVTYFGNGRPQFVAVADVNQDGKPDVVDSNLGVNALLGKGDGTLADVVGVSTGTAHSAQFVIADVDGNGRPDIVVGDHVGRAVGINFPGTNNLVQGGFSLIVLQSIKEITVAGQPITLRRNPDGVDIDWIANGQTSTLPASDPVGLTIYNVAGTSTVTLDFSNGDPLPDVLAFNGTFAVNGLAGADPLFGKYVNLQSGTLYLGYVPGADFASAVQRYLVSGYGTGSWDGFATTSNGVITSTSAAASPAKFSLGWADSGDGVVAGQPANTLEIRNTVAGDTNLDGTVNAIDAITMARHYLNSIGPTWDQGDFNYDGAVDFTDATILQTNFNVIAPASAPASTAETTNSAANAPKTSDGTGGADPSHDGNSLDDFDLLNRSRRGLRSSATHTEHGHRGR